MKPRIIGRLVAIFLAAAFMGGISFLMTQHYQNMGKDAYLAHQARHYDSLIQSNGKFFGILIIVVICLLMYEGAAWISSKTLSILWPKKIEDRRNNTTTPAL
jgi:hypothetical protein